MPTLQELEAQLEKLKAARASGIHSITHLGRSITYRSDDELKAAIDDLTNQIADATGKPRRRRVFGSTITRGT